MVYSVVTKITRTRSRYTPPYVHLFSFFPGYIFFLSMFICVHSYTCRVRNDATPLRANTHRRATNYVKSGEKKIPQARRFARKKKAASARYLKTAAAHTHTRARKSNFDRKNSRESTDTINERWAHAGVRADPRTERMLFTVIDTTLFAFNRRRVSLFIFSTNAAATEIFTIRVHAR